MPGPFHAGELLVQAQAGVVTRAARVGGSIHSEIPPPARTFLEARRFVVLATADPQGRPWASLLQGPPGFISSPDPHTVRMAADLLPGDPLAGHLGTAPEAGLLAIDLPGRRRMRVNGRLEPEHGALVIRVDQVYANCPKHITPRGADPAPGVGPGLGRTAGLTPSQQEWLRRTDTFFIATVNPGEGADASHRGGPPGFVGVEGNRISWPDYAGNMMYNTLGNIVRHPRAGLLVPDFARGGLLLATGTARIDWDPLRAAAVPGAERMVDLEVEEVVQLG